MLDGHSAQISCDVSTYSPEIQHRNIRLVTSEMHSDGHLDIETRGDGPFEVELDLTDAPHNWYSPCILRAHAKVERCIRIVFITTLVLPYHI